MSLLRIGPGGLAVVQLTAGRVYQITSPDACSINIGSQPGGRVQHSVTYAQLRAGVAYSFVPSGADVYLSALSRAATVDLDYVNVRAKPAPIGVPV